MVRRNITLPEGQDAAVLEYMERAGVTRSQTVRMALDLLLKGKVFVPLVGELTVTTTPAKFREFERRLDAAKEQHDDV